MKIKVREEELKIKTLTEDDIPEIMDVQEEAFSVMENSANLRRNTKETFSVCFESPSIAYGVYHGEKMIAFGMLYCAGLDSENLAHSLDEKVDLMTVANVKVIIVRPDFRGNGLQRYVIRKLEEHAVNNGYKILMATVAPDNEYSMSNFTALGYKCVKVLRKYGGLERALLYKEA